jgi:hypothetical protein
MLKTLNMEGSSVPSCPASGLGPEGDEEGGTLGAEEGEGAFLAHFLGGEVIEERH